MMLSFNRRYLDGGVRSYKADKTELYGNIKVTSWLGGLVIDMANKLGRMVFDGAQRYYDTHFEGVSGRCFPQRILGR